MSNTDFFQKVNPMMIGHYFHAKDIVRFADAMVDDSCCCYDNNDVVMVIFNNDATHTPFVCRYFMVGDIACDDIMLTVDNPNYAPVQCTLNDISLIGKVVKKYSVKEFNHGRYHVSRTRISHCG